MSHSLQCGARVAFLLLCFFFFWMLAYVCFHNVDVHYTTDTPWPEGCSSPCIFNPIALKDNTTLQHTVHRFRISLMAQSTFEYIPIYFKPWQLFLVLAFSLSHALPSLPVLWYFFFFFPFTSSGHMDLLDLFYNTYRHSHTCPS